MKEKKKEKEKEDKVPERKAWPSVLTHLSMNRSLVTARIRDEDLVPLGMLGAGQNGSVTKALDCSADAIVALKTINVYERGTRHQLVRELNAYSKLSSQYLIKFLGGFYGHNGQTCLVTEWMDCGSLDHFVSRNGPLPEAVLADITLQMTKGLAYLHSHFSLHRDIKPGNILLDHQGRVKITDFGLLEELPSEEAMANAFTGTMCYMSPERFEHKAYSYPSDIWALGIIVYFCATGELPFSSHDYWKLLDQITQQKPPSLDCNLFSAEIIDFVDMCLHHNPKRRATAPQLLMHPWLADIMEQSSTRTHPELWLTPNGEDTLREVVTALVQRARHDTAQQGEAHDGTLRTIFFAKQMESLSACLQVSPREIVSRYKAELKRTETPLCRESRYKHERPTYLSLRRAVSLPKVSEAIMHQHATSAHNSNRNSNRSSNRNSNRNSSSSSNSNKYKERAQEDRTKSKILSGEFSPRPPSSRSRAPRDIPRDKPVGSPNHPPHHPNIPRAQ